MDLSVLSLPSVRSEMVLFLRLGLTDLLDLSVRLSQSYYPIR